METLCEIGYVQIGGRIPGELQNHEFAQVPGGRVLTGAGKFDTYIFNLLCVSDNCKQKSFFWKHIFPKGPPFGFYTMKSAKIGTPGT